MTDDLIDRVAFALQDGTIHRLKAQRLARAAIAAIQSGDDLGHGIMAVQRPMTSADAPRPMWISPNFLPERRRADGLDEADVKPYDARASAEVLRKLAEATRPR